MEERPILFSAPMVCAILEGRKTQTRRVVSRSNSTVDGWVWDREHFAALDFSEQVVKLYSDPSYRCGCIKYVPCSLDDDPTCGHRVRSCWDAGDRLWVKETYGLGGARLIDPTVNYRADGAQLPLIGHADPETWSIRGNSHEVNDADLLKVPDGWRPSIFMFRWASRITLEVTDVRVQRVQEISFEDAEAEGCDVPEVRQISLYGADKAGREKIYKIHADLGYRPLWDSINAKRGFGWDVNPWVWAITFKRVDGGAK